MSQQESAHSLELESQEAKGELLPPHDDIGIEGELSAQPNHTVKPSLKLFSLLDMKPPISRAKMISITKSAIKAIKLYKHVVQIVEKFIKKCKPEYKVPGLYVVDSIVRQSRHQFGPEKDVFGPRFTKNITGTFQNLYLCPAEDKSKIVRVLNLWQKNGVFKIEIIQPLLDMAAGSTSSVVETDLENDTGNAGKPGHILPPFLIGEALPAVPNLPPERLEDYDYLKQQILLHTAVSTVVKGCQFRLWHIDLDRQIRGQIQGLVDLIQSWIHGDPFKHIL
ncbi:SFR15 protein, partial [Polypterus senegalus]